MLELRKTLRPLLLTLAVGATGACSTNKEPAHKETPAPAQSAAWSYEGRTGPSYWGALSPTYRLAKVGKRQSPIDIRTAEAQNLPAIAFHYSPAPVDVIFNGHTVEQKVANKSSIKAGGTTYELLQFHFHSPSEHTINGEHADMEMHLVHKSAAGVLAVVAVMIHEGDENSAFAPVWANMPDAHNSARTSDQTVDIAALLPQARGYYRYDGSLTTPPCSEGVNWFVLREPVEMSRAQIDKFRSVISGNNRPVQPMYGRRIKYSR